MIGDGFYFEHKRKMKEKEFKEMLREYLPDVLKKLSETGIISIHDGLKESPRIRMNIRG